jgi:predicted dehydrogenase
MSMKSTFTGLKRPIRCGVVGAGYLGEHHIRILSSTEGVEWMGFYEQNAVRADEIKSRYSGRVYSSLEQLAKDCDAVSVVVPTTEHKRVADVLLDAGCHLLVEKPLCATVDEAIHLTESAKNKGLLVQVGHVEHFNPVMGYLEQAIDRPRFITADRLAPFQPRGTEVGVVLDLMIHDIGLVLQLVRQPLVKVESVGVAVLSSYEDIANARLTFADGCIANLNTSRVSEKKVREFRVFQNDTYLSMDFMNQKGHLLQRRDGCLSREEIPLETGEPLRLEIESFIECIRRGEIPKVDAVLGTTALEVAVEITRQIRSQF